MKLYKALARMFLLALLTFMLSACGASQNTGAGPTATHGATPTATITLQNPTSPIKALRMLDHSKGWALTDQKLLSTTDGGQVWQDVTPSGSAYGKYAYGQFMNDKYAWVISTTQPMDNSVNVLRTSDGGQHWQSSTISASAVSVLDPPHFLTTQEGFLELGIGGSAAGSQGAGIFHTTDGGQNWTQVASSNPPDDSFPLVGHKSGISFADVHNGWATGQDASNIPWLYVTHDAGHTWSKQSIPLVSTDPTAQLNYKTTPPVFFGNTGFLPVTASGMFSAGAAAATTVMYIYKTTDSGATWTVIKPQHAFGDSNAAGFASDDLYITDVNHAWGTDAIGRVWGTSDGFNNWQLLNSQMGGDPNSDMNMKALSFVDASYGWGVSKTTLLHTTDGGRTWNEIVYHLAA
jgi:photosystem II stability/assembly factor-like uncharacterized protein